jgi:hypothetical protein
VQVTVPVTTNTMAARSESCISIVPMTKDLVDHIIRVATQHSGNAATAVEFVDKSTCKVSIEIKFQKRPKTAISTATMVQDYLRSCNIYSKLMTSIFPHIS